MPLDDLRSANESEAEERLVFDTKLFELAPEWHNRAANLEKHDRELVQHI